MVPPASRPSPPPDPPSQALAGHFRPGLPHEKEKEVNLMQETATVESDVVEEALAYNIMLLQGDVY
jgi:hypothetical protein